MSCGEPPSVQDAYNRGVADGAVVASVAKVLPTTAPNSAMVPCPYQGSFGTQCPLTVSWSCSVPPCLIERTQHQ